MKKILIFSGTTEGRILAEKLSKTGVSVTVCVATEYGEQMMEETDLVKVHTGRLTIDEMESFIKEEDTKVVVDATHPFATIVTSNLVEVTNKLKVKYLRVERDISTGIKEDFIKYFDDTASCIEELEKTSGKILLTTGSKELNVFCAKEAIRSRTIARILPGMESLQIAYDCGLDGRSIIAMQGPFSKEMNKNLLKEYNIQCLVTKESGKVGGMEEKIDACRELNIPCYIIKKPTALSENKTYSVEEAFKKLVSPKASVEVSLIGIGMGDEAGLSLKAKTTIDNADIIFGAKRMLDTVKDDKKKYPYYLEKDIVPVLVEESKKGQVKAAVLFSGDTGFFSGCEKLYQALLQYENIKPVIIPGASSISYFSSRLGISWQDAKILSTHGVRKEEWTGRLKGLVLENEKVFFITSGPKDINCIADILESDFNEAQIYIGYELSYENEKVFKPSIEECKKISKPGLYVGMIINKNHNQKALTPALTDDDFIRDKVPMTKEEVRMLSICKLGLKPDSVVYDVGSGTGSIAVSMALLSPSIQVIAIETNDLALDLIKKNCEKFNTSNVEIVKALAPEKFDELPIPTHAFIGGSKGNLKEIVTALREKNPNITIVMNAVSIETIAEFQSVTKMLSENNPDISIDIVCINISKAKKIGDYNLMQAANPVYIVTIK